MSERPLAPMPTDEEDAAINAAIEADPEERRRMEAQAAGKLRRLTEDELREHFPITAKYIIASRRREAAAAADQTA